MNIINYKYFYKIGNTNYCSLLISNQLNKSNLNNGLEINFAISLKIFKLFNNIFLYIMLMENNNK